jgi:hypothetical protein
VVRAADGDARHRVEVKRALHHIEVSILSNRAAVVPALEIGLEESAASHGPKSGGDVDDTVTVRLTERLGVSPDAVLLERQSVCVEADQDATPFDSDRLFDAAAGPSTIPMVLDRLHITEPTPVVVIIGGADRMSSGTGHEIRALFERSLIPVLESSAVVVITGGTDSGVMAIAGQTLSSVATLVGVSPRGALAADRGAVIQPDHHLSILTGGRTWGSETDYMVRLANAITQGARCGMVLLVNGGAVAFEEVSCFVEAGWPVLSIAGSGGVADDLVAFSEKRRVRYDWSSLKNADFDTVALTASPGEVRKRFHWYVSQDELLKSAWAYFLALDRRADRQQAFNRRVRLFLQLFSLLILSLVLIQFELNFPIRGYPSYPLWPGAEPLLQTLQHVTVPVAVALPLALAVTSADLPVSRMACSPP